MCRNGSKSINYLFLHCSVAQRIWTKIIQKFGVSWVLPQDINHLIMGNFMSGREKKIKVLWSLVVFAVFWTLWRERNQRIFDDKEASFANIMESVHYWVALWASLHHVLSQIKLVEGLGFCIVVTLHFLDDS